MFPVIIDSGAIITISPDHDDFGPSFAHIEGDVLQGLATSLQIKWTGTLQWALHLNDGSEVELSLLAFYVPCAHQCVLSPHHFLQDTPNIQDGCHFVINTTVLIFVTADD